MSSALDDALRRLALNDEQAIRSVLDPSPLGFATSHLDNKTYALARLAALVSLGAPAASCRWGAEVAQEAGAGDEEIVGILWAVGPVVGLARVVSAVPALALAIGHDVEAAFEDPAESR